MTATRMTGTNAPGVTRRSAGTDRDATCSLQHARIRGPWGRMSASCRAAEDFYYTEASGPACQ